MVSRRWLIALLVGIGLVGGCSQFNTNLTSQTSSSALTFLSPQGANAGDAAFTITANGGGFVTGAIILWNVGPNQVQLVTTFVNSTQVTANVPNSDLAAAGTIRVAVQIPGSAVSGASGTTATTTTEVSNVVDFTINPTPGPTPVITSLSANPGSGPSTPYCGASAIALTVMGSNFDSTSAVNWNGSHRTTTFVTSSQLTASILPQDAAFSGTANVSVSNASGPSNSVVFTMTTPAQPSNLLTPVLTKLSQTSIAAGSASFTLRADGNFSDGTPLLPCTVIQWNTSVSAMTVINTLPTTFVPASQPDPITHIIDPIHLTATVPAAFLVAVQTPAPKVVLFVLPPLASPNTSNAITFTIQ